MSKLHDNADAICAVQGVQVCALRALVGYALAKLLALVKEK